MPGPSSNAAINVRAKLTGFNGLVSSALYSTSAGRVRVGSSSEDVITAKVPLSAPFPDSEVSDTGRSADSPSATCRQLSGLLCSDVIETALISSGPVVTVGVAPASTQTQPGPVTLSVPGAFSTLPSIGPKETPPSMVGKPAGAPMVTGTSDTWGRNSVPGTSLPVSGFFHGAVVTPRLMRRVALPGCRPVVSRSCVPVISLPASDAISFSSPLASTRTA